MPTTSVCHNTTVDRVDDTWNEICTASSCNNKANENITSFPLFNQAAAALLWTTTLHCNSKQATLLTMKFPFSLSSGAVVLVLTATAAVASMAQDYDYDDGYQGRDGYGGQGGDYYGQDAGGYYEQEDTLYQDYAKHQEEKAMGGAG